MDMLITTVTSRDEQDREARVAVLPVGSFEQHGGFLALITDTIVVCVIARRLGADYELLLLPPVTLSCSHEHSGFAGTVSISAETLIAVVADVAESLRRSGIERLAIVNGHGGNYVLANVVQQANVAGPRMTLFPGRTEWDAARAAAGLQASTSEDMHAGELEVSLLLHAYPELVGEDFRHGDWAGACETASAGHRHAWLHRVGRYWPTVPCNGREGTRDPRQPGAVLQGSSGAAVMTFSTTSRPALRAASGRPPARQRRDGHRGTGSPSCEEELEQSSTIRVTCRARTGIPRSPTAVARESVAVRVRRGRVASSRSILTRCDGLQRSSWQGSSGWSGRPSCSLYRGLSASPRTRSRSLVSMVRRGSAMLIWQLW
jgi:creatinine amidohydrolase